MTNTDTKSAATHQWTIRLEFDECACCGMQWFQFSNRPSRWRPSKRSQWRDGEPPDTCATRKAKSAPEPSVEENFAEVASAAPAVNDTSAATLAEVERALVAQYKRWGGDISATGALSEAIQAVRAMQSERPTEAPAWAWDGEAGSSEPPHGPLCRGDCCPTDG